MYNIHLQKIKDMFSEEKIKEFFPNEEQIPDEFRLTYLINQNDYLINGEILLWKGRKKRVYSPILVKDDRGLKKKLIGYYPLLSKKEAIKALFSAVKAYDNGRGFWPCLSIIERIKYIERFLSLLKAKIGRAHV